MPHGPLLFIELGLLFTGMSVLALLARKFGLSAIPLYLVAGLAFDEGGILDVKAAEGFVEAGSQLGMLLLLLLLGLEFSTEELRSSLQRHTNSGLVDIALNLTPGLLIGVLLDLPVGGVLALGGITWISSSGIIARLLDDLGRLSNRETPAVLSVLVLEDLAMALYLPVLVVVLSGGTVRQAALGVLLAVALVCSALLASHRGRHRLRTVLSHPDNEQVLLRMLGLALIVAGLAEWAGASAAIGAFLVGLAVPSDIADRTRALLGPLRALFASVFFVGFGLATDPAEVLPALPGALLLTLVTAGTKFATGWFAASRDGCRQAGKVRAGTVLIPRGEFSIVIAGMAAAAGIAEIAPLATAYVLLTAIVGPVLAKQAERAGAGQLPRAKPG